MAGREPASSPESDPRRRSSLLGPRKSASPPEKPAILTRRNSTPLETAPATPVVPTPTPSVAVSAKAKATPKAAPKAKAPAKPKLSLASLQEQIAELQAALQRCPSWTDLELLEARLQSLSQDPAETEKLQEDLQNRKEELDELADINAEQQEEIDEMRLRLAKMHRQLGIQEEYSGRLEARLRQAESFLRESLLSLLSPGDEFNDELVEQIQLFLSP